MGRRATMLNLCYQLSCGGIGKPRGQDFWESSQAVMPEVSIRDRKSGWYHPFIGVISPGTRVH